MIKPVFFRCGFLLLPIFLGACMKDEDTDYCKNHYRFHDRHLESIAMLNLELNNSGVLNSELRLPGSALSDLDGTVRLLEQTDRVYSLQTTTPCGTADFESMESEGSVIARYQSDCGLDNRLEQVDVALFESLPTLDEMVVNVTTPATAKRFAISRQCEQAIFRFDQKPLD